MAATVNCWICGKEHEYCPACDRVHGWKYVADTHEHYQIYMTIEDYRKGCISKEEATRILSDTCNVSAENDLSWMLSNVEKGVREIIGDRTPTAKEKPKFKK